MHSLVDVYLTAEENGARVAGNCRRLNLPGDALAKVTKDCDEALGFSPEIGRRSLAYKLGFMRGWSRAWR